MVRGEIHLSLLRDATDYHPDIEYDIRQSEVALDKELLQLVQGACKADNLGRALDVTRLMHNNATIEAAAKVAGFYHLPGLQERMQGVRGNKELARIKAKRIRREGPEVTSAHESSSRSFSDFAPRNGGPRRSFGGIQRDATPIASGRSETYIPQTPGAVGVTEDERRSSPPGEKRKRLEEESGLDVDDFVLPDMTKTRVEEFPLTMGLS